MSARPLVSVIIPTYNRAGFVTDAVESALAQTAQNLEVIVVDDGSTDGTREALARYDGRIRAVYQEHANGNTARNRGVTLARGRYVAFLDSDDLWLPEKLEAQLAYLAAHPRIAMVFTDVVWLERDGTQRPSRFRRYRPRDGAVLEETICHPCVVPQTMLLKREVFDMVRFDEALPCGQGFDFIIRLAMRFEIGLVDRPLTVIRRHAANLDPKWDDLCRHDADVKYQAFFVDFGRICDKEPALLGTHRQTVRRALATVYRDWGMALDASGRRREARQKLAESLKRHPRVETLGQLGKTFVPHRVRRWLRPNGP